MIYELYFNKAVDFLPACLLKKEKETKSLFSFCWKTTTIILTKLLSYSAVS